MKKVIYATQNLGTYNDVHVNSVTKIGDVL